MKKGNMAKQKKYYEKCLKKNKNKYLKSIIELKLKDINGQYDLETKKYNPKISNRILFKKAEQCYFKGDYETAEKLCNAPH